MSSHGSHEASSSEKHAVSHDIEPAGQLHQDVGSKAVHGHQKTVHNAELFAAVNESNIHPWSKESIHMYFAIFIAFLCACANGYDGSLMTSILAMKHFQNVFQTGTTGTQVSVIFSLYTVGSMVGAPFAAVLSDRFGRKKGMFAGSIVIIVGMIIISTANHVPQFVVGRFVLGLGIAVMTVAAPAYAVEIAPPHWRGRCTGFYNCGWFGGAIPATIITFGCNNIDSDFSWRIPLILQAFTCVIVMSSVFFLPESPRFLMANGREEEAIAFLTKYHGNGNREAPLVVLQVEEMREGIKLDGIDKNWWDYRPFLLTHSGRWRMAQVLMISIFGQFSGNGLGYFNTVIFDNLGIKDVPTQLAYNILNQVISAIGALTAVAFTDRMPRRAVLVYGTLTCAAALAVNSGLSAALATQTEQGNVQPSYARGALASYFLFNVFFSFTYTPLQGAIPTEALETTTRAKGLAASGFIVSAVSFINQFAGPIALGNIGYKYIYVFVAWDIVEALLWFLFGVESQGRTLEQLEWVYQQPNPVKASLKVDKIIIQDDGRVIEKVEGAADL
ncbi:general substrate transporter [Podospora didyma]|uniref:General substrate transporter n=1 Tax=Podospora didyma TaxID=330526 RepID=A0AAE0P4S7_9PEZI|nr:general substrate transporter [Podospora didyma]